MATRRRNAAAEGQRSLTPLAAAEPALRSRGKSGLRIGHHPPLKFLRLLDELRAVIASIGAPCWQMQDDSQRLNRLQLDGFAANQYTYSDVVSRSPLMVETLHEMLPTRAA